MASRHGFLPAVRPCCLSGRKPEVHNRPLLPSAADIIEESTENCHVLAIERQLSEHARQSGKLGERPQLLNRFIGVHVCPPAGDLWLPLAHLLAVGRVS